MNSVVEIFRESCRHQPQNNAIEVLGEIAAPGRSACITYYDLAQRLEECSQNIRSALGSTSKFCETCIAILDSDSVESTILQLSLMDLGFSFVMISPKYSLEIFR